MCVWPCAWGAVITLPGSICVLLVARATLPGSICVLLVARATPGVPEQESKTKQSPYRNTARRTRSVRRCPRPVYSGLARNNTVIRTKPMHVCTRGYRKGAKAQHCGCVSQPKLFPTNVSSKFLIFFIFFVSHLRALCPHNTGTSAISHAGRQQAETPLTQMK